jgi:hypothetical protein
MREHSPEEWAQLIVELKKVRDDTQRSREDRQRAVEILHSIESKPIPKPRQRRWTDLDMDLDLDLSSGYV